MTKTLVDIEWLNTLCVLASLIASEPGYAARKPPPNIRWAWKDLLDRARRLDDSKTRGQRTAGRDSGAVRLYPSRLWDVGSVNPDGKVSAVATDASAHDWDV